MSQYQSFLKDCDCKSGGLIFKDNIPVCRWCRKPYGKGGNIIYEDYHFLQPKANIPVKDYRIEAFKQDSGVTDLWLPVDGNYNNWARYYNGKSVTASYTFNEIIKSPLYKIHSVTRLSDGVCFSVGEMEQYEYIDNGNPLWRNFKIKSFSIQDDKILVHDEFDNLYGLNSITKLPNNEQPSTESELVKPPLGLMPEWLWKEQRFNELCLAIKRYVEYDKEIPQEWVNEKYDLDKWLNSREQQPLHTDVKEQVPIEVKDILVGARTNNLPLGNYYTLVLNQPITNAPLSKLKVDIEQSLNCTEERLYTEKEYLQGQEDAFNAARELDVTMKGEQELFKRLVHKTFSDYKNKSQQL